MIRKACVEDIASIVDLWEEMMNFHIKKSDLYEIKPNARQIYAYYLKEVLKSHESIVLVHEIKNEIAGYLMAGESLIPPVYKEEKIGTVMDICVTKKHRNKGIGEKLLTETEKWFTARNISRIECTVSNFNEISKGFWFKNNYTPYNITCVKKLR